MRWSIVLLVTVIGLVGAIVPVTATPVATEAYEIVWTGDILLADAAQPAIDARGYDWPLALVAPLLAGDFAVGNAEGPITVSPVPFFPDATWSYNAQPAAAAALATAGFDAIGLSNNHVFDRGPAGVSDSIQYTRAAGLRPFGAGMNDAEAAAPLLIETPLGAVAILGFGEDWRFGRVAGPGQPGTIPYTVEAIERGKAFAAEAGARWTIAYVHWGENYGYVTAEQRRVAAAFAAAGYDLVVGHHPHVPQEVDLIDGMPVLYSLGNFVFGTEGRFTAEFPGYGLVARTFFGSPGVERIELTCIVTDNDLVRYQPRPCDAAEAERVMDGLGPHVVWDDGVGLVVP